MKSPFPGMDPYLERHWPDVHTKLVAYAADELNRRLPGGLLASTEERVAIESEELERHLTPDVLLLELEPGSEGQAVATAPAAVAAPYRILAQVEPRTERYIRVISARTQRLVSVIEFVSPANKLGAGLAAFRSKRGELVASGVNFVEIDLIRAGDWHELMRPHHPLPESESLYRATIRVPRDPASLYLFPIALGDPLPDLVIPLREHDPEIKLPLQELLDRAYANGRYEQRLDYSRDLEPPLQGADAARAAELLAPFRQGAGR